MVTNARLRYVCLKLLLLKRNFCDVGSGLRTLTGGDDERSPVSLIWPEDWKGQPMRLTRWPDLWGAANLLAMVLCIAPAFAQTQQQIDWCTNKGNAYSPDLRIIGCTAAIRSGRWSGPDVAWAFVGRCWAYTDNGNYDQAFADCNRAIELDPKSALAYNNRCWTYIGIGNYDQAIADCTRATELNPKNALAYDNRCLAYIEQGNHDRAIADCNQAIRLDPEFSTAYNNRCWARAVAGHELQAALTDCNEALQLSPDNAHYLNSRALVQLKLGAFDAAIADYSAAIVHNPKDAGSLYARGVAKLKKGDTAGGNADIAAAKAIRSDVDKVYAGYGVT